MIEKLATKAHENALTEHLTAVRAIPEKYQDFLIMLPQNQVLIDRAPERSECPLPQGCFVWKNKTYIKVEAPYFLVAGRIKWFCDDHREAGAKYSITTNISEILELLKNGQPIPSGYPFVTIIESELHGHAEALASIHMNGRGADATHPLENAETSSLGRVLAKMGYGLLGSGLASAEEIEDAMYRRRELKEEKPKEKDTSKDTAKAPEITPEIVEIISESPEIVETKKGICHGYMLEDGRMLMVPSNTPILEPGTKARVSGAEFQKDDKTILLAKTLEDIA